MANQKFIRWRAKQLRLQHAAKLGRDVQQGEVAQAIGMSITALSNIENNKMKGVEFSTLERLAQFYGVDSVCDLLEFSEEPRVEKPAPGLVSSMLASA